MVYMYTHVKLQCTSIYTVYHSYPPFTILQKCYYWSKPHSLVSYIIKEKKIWQRNYFWCKLHLRYPIHKLVHIFLKTYSISIRRVRCMLKSANISPFYGSDTLNVLHLHKADIWILKNWILWNGRWFNCKKLIWIMLIYDPPSQVYMAI